MTKYAVDLTREGAHVLVSFPDFPNVHTYGSDEDEALTRAVDALETYFMGMIEDRQEIRQPHRPKRRKRFIIPSRADGSEN